MGKANVASLLSLDVAGAFDNVSHERLLHNLRVKGVPNAIVQWTASFLRGRATSITLGYRTSEMEPAETGIPQGSPISPILFLFFNAPLIEECAQAGFPVQVGGFVDDIHLLAYSKSTERNCEVLGRAHKICLRWARTHGATFAPKKYELVHLTRRPKRVNLAATVQIDQATIEPETAIRVSGLWIDTKLRWGPHLAKVQMKLSDQVQALKCMSASTWGVTFHKAREVYRAVVTPVMMFAAPIWHEPKGTGKSTEALVKRLAVVQNNCPRSILGAYKATPVQVLEAEAEVPPVRIQLGRALLA